MTLPTPVCVQCGVPKVFLPGTRWTCLKCDVRKPANVLSPQQREDLQRVMWGAIRSGFLGDELCRCCGGIPTLYVVTDPHEYTTEWCCPARADVIARTKKIFARGILPHHQAMWNLLDLL